MSITIRVVETNSQKVIEEYIVEKNFQYLNEMIETLEKDFENDPVEVLYFNNVIN